MRIPFADKTITVYNSFIVKDEYGKNQLYWTSFVFKNNCIFKKTQQSKYSNMVGMDGDIFTAQAPNNDNYLDYFDWGKLQLDEINNYFTVQNGDIIVLGEIAIEIPLHSNPHIEIKKIYPNIGDRMFKAKTAQVNISKELTRTSHFQWAG